MTPRMLGRRRDWRNRRALMLVAICVFGSAAVIPAILTATGLRWQSGAAAAVIVGGALAAIAAALAQDSYKEARRRHEAAVEAYARKSLTDGAGRPMLVRRLADPVLLGVHPSVPSSDALTTSGLFATNPRVPSYIARDVDATIRQLLGRNVLVVLLGDSATGKSRTAFEAMAAVLPDHVLVAPDGRADIAAALEAVEGFGKCVLWLDDLERYIGTGGLTRAGLFRFLDRPGHRVAIATMRTLEYARVMEPPAGSRDDREFLRDAHDVLQQANIVRLERVFSAAELDCASAIGSDLRIAEAVRHAHEYGIAEYLAAGPALLQTWLNAWSVGHHPRAAALIAAAVDARRAGLTRAIPRRLIENVHGGYLAANGGDTLAPETVVDAWTWASAPRMTTVGLLTPAAEPAPGDVERINVFDYLVDAVDHDRTPDNQVPEATLSAAIDYSDADEAERIGSLAYRTGRYAVARRAYRHSLGERRRILGDRHPAAVRSLMEVAWLARETGNLHEAESGLRRADRLLTRVHGARHPETLANLSNLSMLLLDIGKIGEAEASCRVVAEVRAELLGTDHPETLVSGSDLAWILRFDKTRLAEAEAECLRILELRQQILGPDHLDTLISRANLAVIIFDAGRNEEGETECRETLYTRIRALGTEHPHTLRSRSNLAWMLQRAGKLDEADRVSNDAVEALSRILGAGHPDVLASQTTRIAVLMGLDRWDEADHLCRTTLRKSENLLGRDHPRTKHLRISAARTARHLT